MCDHAGLLRSATGLRAALRSLAALAGQPGAPTADALTAANAALVARLVVASALLREESRGAHARSDFPAAEGSFAARTFLTLEDIDDIGARASVIAPSAWEWQAGAAR
jgi:L-aspartate oxidase